MPNLVFRFPGGRYHATPWGNHVNEGLVEWPPSPWRLIRALLATGFTKLGWVEPPREARELVEGLASMLPIYRLPAAIGSHTRHYMPTDSKNPEDRTKVFDAFARLRPGAELGVAWPAALTDGARGLLAELVPRMSYLGRAESVVDARLVEDAELPDGDLASAVGVNRPGVEPIALLAPMTSADYSAWRNKAAAEEPAKTGTSSKGAKTRLSPYPTDALAALLVDTAFLQQHGWTQPPGSRRVLYYRTPLSTSPSRSPSQPTLVRQADTALFALASNTRNGNVLPLLARALPQLELLHRGLLSRVGDVRCPELSGRGDDGAPLEGHRHAVLVPLDLAGDGQLDHVLVHAPMGFGADAQRALRGLRSTYTKGGDAPLFVTLVGLGTCATLSRIGARAVAELGESCVWESRTPFVPPRHLKATRHTLGDQVQAELVSRGLPPALRVESLDRDELVLRGFHRFVRERRHPARPSPTPRFFGLRIEFERPVRGPLALGYASHFGLGLFVPVRG
ncbi:MAG: type I-U CRISPR-associated protein Cas5/Cas6 [Myxococcales bacterium]|nr:type I-U CRISPR-associated protein Cas5/Cas6 [Myxococcales bacterium]